MTHDRPSLSQFAQQASAEEVIRRLELQIMSVEGGYIKFTHREPGMSTCYYLVTQDNFCALHTLSSSTIWHYYAGAPAQLIHISPEGQLKQMTLGGDVLAGQIPQASIPGGHYQGARVFGKGWTLFGCTVSPAYDISQYKPVRRFDIIKQFPRHFDILSRFTR